MSTASADTPLFVDHAKVYPRAVHGWFRRTKWWALAALLAIYYLTPWLRWDRGPDAPDQAILIDLPARRAYFFVIEIWPQEIYYLAGLMILAAIGLFFVTSYLGRMWCGFACPQTVWTDLFMWAERQIEGDRNARMRLDAMPWTIGKLARKATKHAVWLVIAFATGGAWIMYFKDAPTLASEFFVGESSYHVYVFTGLFTATTYVLAGWAREQVCTYMCPWPRFQSAMFDENTLTVTYRDWRGEPRGKKPTTDTGWAGRGDCIDCYACVNSCPTGIDIRDGIQLECIGCGLCIDACDEIMDRVGRPRGLIAFDTENRRLAMLAGQQPAAVPLLRLRPALYAMLMIGVATLLAYQVLTRESLALTVLHDRSPLFVTLANGDLRNGYTLKVHNKQRTPRQLTLSLTESPQDATFRIAGQNADTVSATLAAAPDSVSEFRVHVRVSPDSIGGASTPLAFQLTDTEAQESATYRTTFRGPN